MAGCVATAFVAPHRRTAGAVRGFGLRGRHEPHACSPARVGVPTSRGPPHSFRRSAARLSVGGTRAQAARADDVGASGGKGALMSLSFCCWRVRRTEGAPSVARTGEQQSREELLRLLAFERQERAKSDAARAESDAARVKSDAALERLASDFEAFKAAVAPGGTSKGAT